MASTGTLRGVEKYWTVRFFSPTATRLSTEMTPNTTRRTSCVVFIFPSSTF